LLSSEPRPISAIVAALWTKVIEFSCRGRALLASWPATPAEISAAMPDQTYVPHPVDTSHVSLDDLQPLLESLARNAHEIWAQQRLRDGWTYGAHRDDVKRTHPCLVPYENLSESEKDYDRIMVNEALKAIIAMGYSIAKR
jgi:hypothetical protein